MNHLNQIFRPTFSWLIAAILIIGTVPSMSAQNQNCADVDFNYEIFGNTVRLTGTSKDNILQWYWSFGNGTSATGQTATISYDKNGVYEICLKVLAVSPIATSNAGCTGLICKKITIGNITTTNDDCGLEADFEIQVAGNDIRLTGKSNDPNATYLWYISSQNVQKTGRQVSFTTDKPGVYEVCMIVVNGAETCKVRLCKKVQIGQNCTLEADFSFELLDGVFRFTAKSNLLSPTAAGFEYFWEFGDGNTSSGIAVKHIYTNDGIYNVCLTVRDTRTGCTTRICKTVNSDGNCDLKADFKTLSSLNGINFTGRSNSENAKYYWDFGNGSRGEGQNVRTKYETPGVYTVCLTVVDEVKKCKVQVCKRVLVGRTLGPTVTNTDNPAIRIFPNPVNDIVNIQSNGLKIQQIIIFNAQQVPVMQRSANDGLVTLDVSALPTGIYLVHAVLEDGTVLSARFYKN
ncbi:MAG: PKD domain-containing protein [Saprospiraceae bacterium]|nr:PKD domain-containing protein [Saprospiraceae bacterium]